MMRNKPTHQIRVAAEMLEDRIAPATLPLLDISSEIFIGTFIDSDGDRISVRIEGSAGKVEFQDINGGSVDDGEEIASVIITGASADFALTYSFDASGGATSLNNVAMGNITSNKLIRGISSVPLNGTTGTFTLGSFAGPGFSPGGGLAVDDVAGNADGIGIQVNSLGVGRFINIRNTITGDLTIPGSLGGTINVGSTVETASAWLIGKNVTPTAQIVVDGSFNGTFETRGVFGGDVQIDSSVTGVWTFNGNVLKSARLSAGDWVNIQARKNWGGQVSSPSGGVTLAVGGQILGTTVVSGENALDLNVDGSVQSGATFGSSSEITATVGGNLAGNWTSSGDVSLTVGGNISGGIINAGGVLSLTVGKSILNSKLMSDSNLALDVTGNVNSTELMTDRDLIANIAGSFANSKASVAEDLTILVEGDFSKSVAIGDLAVIVDVGGRLAGSHIVAERPDGTAIDPAFEVEVALDVIASVISGHERVATLSVGGNFVGSTVSSEEIGQMTVSGSLVNSTVEASSNVTVAVTQNVKGSTITSAFSDIILTVGGSYLASSVSCDETIQITVGGNMGGIVNSFSSDITLTVGGTMSGNVIAGEEIIADIGQLSGSLSSFGLDLVVQRDVAASARIQASDVDDFNSDTAGFRVGGNFGGILNVSDFDSDVLGGSTLVEGDVLKSARFNVGSQFGDAADESFTFGGDFLGTLSIGGDIDVNLAFAGDVNQVIIGGLVGTTGAVNTIAIGGKLKFLSSGSFFKETIEAETGSFVNGTNTESATLTVEGGFKTVTPVVGAAAL
jgi:hypothetical protein